MSLSPGSAAEPVRLTEQAVKDRLEAALRALMVKDIFLLENKTGERAVVAKLAAHMAPLFPDYDVDVEYNRQGLNPNDPKSLTLGPECRRAKKKDGQEEEKKKRRVYPDIIVHRRGQQLDHNLLVVEVKRTSNKEPRDCDRQKIEAMIQHYRYSFGVLVEVPSGPSASEREPLRKWWKS